MPGKLCSTPHGAWSWPASGSGCRWPSSPAGPGSAARRSTRSSAARTGWRRRCRRTRPSSSWPELATVLESYPDDPVAGTRAAVAHTLRTGADDPLLKAILSSARGPSELLPLLTTRAEPLLESSRKLLTGYLTDHWPHLSTRDVALVADSVDPAHGLASGAAAGTDRAHRRRHRDPRRPGAARPSLLNSADPTR